MPQSAISRKVSGVRVANPTTIWLLVVATLFATEYGVMCVLSDFIAADPSPFAAALIDSLTLTVVISPVIWWLLVRPLRKLLQLRTEVLGELFKIIEVERRQTAHELHDGLGQELSLLISGLRTAHETMEKGQDQSRCQELERLAQSALKEVKRIARGLRPSLLDDFGLVAAVEKLVQDFVEHSSVELTIHCNIVEGVKFPETMETAAFRIIQEGLANVVRHSGAKHAVINLDQRDDSLCISIRDDGNGFDPKRVLKGPGETGQIGLIGIRERVTLLGGDFTLESAPSKGCLIEVTLPQGGWKRG